MTERLFTILSLFILFIFTGCSEKYLEQENQEYFTKLYRAVEDVDAVDFIIKPDNNGFLILGNSKVNANSNIILFDLNSNGYVRKAIELNTEAFDEGKKIYLSDNNDIYLLGHRKLNNQEDQVTTILIKTDLNANFDNYIDSINYEGVRELSFEEDDDVTSFIMNDMGIINETLMLAGYIEDAGRKNAIARSYNLSSLFDDLSIPVSHNNQIPISSNISFDNSQFKKIGLFEYEDYPLSIYGQKINSKGETDISNYLIEDIENFRFISPNITLPNNQNVQAYHVSAVDNSIIFAGNNQSEDSIFVLRSIFSPSISSDSINYNILSINYFGGYGGKIVDIAQTRSGDLLIASLTDEIDRDVVLSRNGNILRFSFLANAEPAREIELSIAGNGFQNIKKIKYDLDNNITYILSGVTLGTEETAIELSKVMF